jgi:hypothetical protein
MAGQPGWLGLIGCSNTSRTILLCPLTYLTPMQPHLGQVLSETMWVPVSCHHYQPQQQLQLHQQNSLPCTSIVCDGLKTRVTIKQSVGHQDMPDSCFHGHHCLRPQAWLPLPSPLNDATWPTLPLWACSCHCLHPCVSSNHLLYTISSCTFSPANTTTTTSTFLTSNSHHHQLRRQGSCDVN